MANARPEEAPIVEAYEELSEQVGAFDREHLGPESNTPTYAQAAEEAEARAEDTVRSAPSSERGALHGEVEAEDWEAEERQPVAEDIEH
ncbi:MAG TPA: hypothetical protein VFH51_14470 [Myxococcota bacterium]|nr:hypothetical protein [Myxococcota bacterium]